MPKTEQSIERLYDTRASNLVPILQDFRPIVIGLAGAAGSGKDTIAEHLHRANDFYPMAFATPIRYLVGSAFGLTKTQYEQAKRRKDHVLGRYSLRKLGQSLGTEWGRDMMGENFWTHALAYRMYSACLAGMQRFVVSDVRFDNEADFIHQIGGEVWSVHRKFDTDPVEGTTHRSTKPIPRHQIDRFINNSDDINDLYSRVGVELGCYLKHHTTKEDATNV